MNRNEKSAGPAELPCAFSILSWRLAVFSITVYQYFYPSFSASSIHSLAQASDGMRRSPLGDSATLPTFGPSGRQERLNCWEKNLL